MPLLTTALLLSATPVALPEQLALQSVQPAPAAPAPVIAQPYPAPETEQDTPAVEPVPAEAPSPEAPPADPLAAQQPPATEQADPAAPDQTPDTVIVVEGQVGSTPGDPLEDLNAATFEFTQDVDEAIVEPLAMAYQDALPKPVRSGLKNFFRNLLEPVNAINFLLQLKIGKAFETLGRFAINTTFGVVGLVDVAKDEPFNLPYRRNGFANTLGYYGVGPGPFLVLPLIGSTTLRDLLGSGIDQAFLPFAVGQPFNSPVYGITAYTINSLEFRLEYDATLQGIQSAPDPYVAMRETYLCRRESDIALLKNREPRDCSLEALIGPIAAPPAAAGDAAVEMPAPAPESVEEPVDAAPTPDADAPSGDYGLSVPAAPSLDYANVLQLAGTR